MPDQVFHKSNSILGKHVTCLIKAFSSQSLFWVSMWLAWSIVSQIELYFGQACDLPDQVFHKSKTNLGKHVTCLSKCFTSRKLFWASMRLAWASVSQIEIYFGQACDLLRQGFHNSKLFWTRMWLAWSSLSQHKNYFGQACDLPEQVFRYLFLFTEQNNGLNMNSWRVILQIYLLWHTIHFKYRKKQQQMIHTHQNHVFSHSFKNPLPSFHALQIVANHICDTNKQTKFLMFNIKPKLN